MKFKLLIILAVVFLFSCHKEPLPLQPKSIAELTENLEGEIKELTDIRLSFGIAVSNALEDVEFRDYIYELSKKNTTEFFNEIVFALHKDDIAVGDKTLATVISETASKETKNMYGDDFIDMVLKIDPLVTIKIPDIFYNFDWETEKYAPLVGIKTPLSIGKNDYVEYLGYHYSGYMDIRFPRQFYDYFTIVVKYSEDYILYSPLTNMNEKNISLFELIPQLEKCEDYMSDYLRKTGIKSPVFNNMLYINRRNVEKEFIKNCEGDYIYYGEMVMDSCQKECVRDCIENSEDINDVFEKFTILNDALIESAADNLFNDNPDILFFLHNPDNKIFDMYMITGFRKSEYFGRKITFEKNISKEIYEKIGKATLPRIKITKKYTTNKDIYINHRFRKGWGKGSDESFCMLNLSIVKYSDIVNSEPILYSYEEPPLILNCTELIAIDQSPFDYCMAPQLDKYYNVVMISLKQRY